MIYLGALLFAFISMLINVIIVIQHSVLFGIIFVLLLLTFVFIFVFRFNKGGDEE